MACMCAQSYLRCIRVHFGLLPVDDDSISLFSQKSSSYSRRDGNRDQRDYNSHHHQGDDRDRHRDRSRDRYSSSPRDG